MNRVNVCIIHQSSWESSTGINNMISVIPEDFLLQLKGTNYTMTKSVQ